MARFTAPSSPPQTHVWRLTLLAVINIALWLIISFFLSSQPFMPTLLAGLLAGLGTFALHGRLLSRSWLQNEVTEQSLRHLQYQLKEGDRRWYRTFNQSPLAAAILTPDLRLLDVNGTLCRLFEQTRTDLLNGHYLDLLHPEEREAENERLQNLLKHGQESATTHASTADHYTVETRCRDVQGRTLWVHLSMSLVRNDQGQPLYLLPLLQDISLRRQAQEQVEYLAYHDAMTGLPNRLLAKDRLSHAIAYARRETSGVGVLHLDLDHFKSINDTLGHPVGDALLQQVALTLRDCVRTTDTIARLGGDEFLIILTNVQDAEIISSIATKIQDRLASTFKVSGHELSTSASIGISVFPQDGEDFDSLLQKADTALYKAKGNGRNAYQFFTEQMNSEAVEYLKIRNGLRQALIKNEFLLHYQPQINLADGKVVGVEALIRWNHPELGLLQPGRFIDIAEDSGLIVPMGDWVLRQACQQAVEWRSAGLPPIVVAVNLSAIQFKRGDVEKSVIQALNTSGHDPNYLELELTESILIHDTERMLATLQRLKAMGMKLSIDDFGTGYSSLSYLKRFEVDKLKIDQSFVRDMANDRNDAAIVQAIIQMARSLKLQVIAEGVEDEQLVRLLHDQQCDEAQGYHFARPMTPNAFVDYMEQLRPMALAG